MKMNDKIICAIIIAAALIALAASMIISACILSDAIEYSGRVIGLNVSYVLVNS